MGKTVKETIYEKMRKLGALKLIAIAIVAWFAISGMAWALLPVSPGVVSLAAETYYPGQQVNHSFQLTTSAPPDHDETDGTYSRYWGITAVVHETQGPIAPYTWIEEVNTQTWSGSRIFEIKGPYGEQHFQSVLWKHQWQFDYTTGTWSITERKILAQEDQLFSVAEIPIPPVEKPLIETVLQALWDFLFGWIPWL